MQGADFVVGELGSAEADRCDADNSVSKRPFGRENVNAISRGTDMSSE
jgi:hypothetical protein